MSNTELNILSDFQLEIFFDESGKKNLPALMGGLAIPSQVYNSSQFSVLTDDLRNHKYSLHWTDYAGHGPTTKAIINTITSVMKHYQHLTFNVISYFKPYDCHNLEVFYNMVYTKLPERILYGLLRGYGKGVEIEANIQIESAREYIDRNLSDKLLEQLNIQAAYRGEKFSINTSELTPKGREVGLELTDLLLGIMRTIILNKPETESKKIASKTKLVLTLLQNQDLYNFFSNMKLFEWNSTRVLSEINFMDYMKIFLSSKLQIDSSKTKLIRKKRYVVRSRAIRIRGD